MLSWHYITSAQYKAAAEEEKTSEKLFFLSDTKEIYRGTESFTESVILFTTEPESPAVGKLYINSTTLEGKMWNGTAWTTVIQPVQATLDKADTAKPVSGKAVADHVEAVRAALQESIDALGGSSDLVKSIAYSDSTNTVTYTTADGETHDVVLTNVGMDLKFNKTTGKLEVLNAAGTVLGKGVNLDIERFVHSGEYDTETQNIILYFNDDKTDKVEIPAAALVDTYTAGDDTTTAHVDITENKVTVSVKISAAEGNILVAKEDGLYVGAVDQSAKMDKDTDAVVGNLAKFDANHNAVDAGLIAGGATLATKPVATTLATEAAVEAIRSGLQTNIDKKMNKVATSAAGQIIVASASGDAEASGKKLGGDTFAATPNGTTLATEGGVAGYVQGYAVAKTNIAAAASMATTVGTASDDKVASEKALVQSMTWKTTV